MLQPLSQADESSSLSDIIKTDLGTPIGMYIETSINTIIHVVTVALLQTKLLTYKQWKKLSVATVALPNLIGFTIWLVKDTVTTRILYMWGLFLTFVVLIGTALTEFVFSLILYLETGSDLVKKDLVVLATFVTIYGIVVLLLNLSFCDYHYQKTDEENELARLKALIEQEEPDTEEQF